jgi:hypothetical protein
MPSYSDYLYGAIIQEYHNLFNVEYSDKMYQSLVYYTDSRTALKANKYSLRTLDDGFSLYKNGEFFAEMHMDAYSAPFLNAWISGAVSGLTLFPVGFDKANPKEMQGKLAQYSARYVEEIQDLNVTPQQADVGAIELFMSNEIVSDGDNSIFKVDPKSVKAIPRNDFEDKGKVSFDDDSEDEDESDSEEDDEEKAPAAAKEKPEPEKNKKEATPFYYVISMEKKGKKLESLPKIWKKKVKEDGLSWEFEDGRLYVSNTKGASYGLPPAPHHLCGLPKLTISLNDWEGVSTPEERESTKGAGTTAPTKTTRELTGDSEWEKLTEQFMTNPCMSTFKGFRDSEEVFSAFELHKDDAGYRMGSNKKPLSQEVRKVIRGEQNAITWPEFTDLLDKTARPNDTKGIMILLFKFRLYVAETRDGNVYVTTQ